MKSSLEKFKDYLENEAGLRSEDTKKIYYYLVKKILDDCRWINYESVRDYCRSISPEVGSQNTYVSAFKKYGKFKGWKWVKKLKRRPEPHHPPQIIPDEEIEWAHKQYKYGSRDWMFILLFSYTAARPSEVTRLRVNDISFTDDSITFQKTKNGKIRRIKIPKRVRSHLRDYLQKISTSYLFPTARDPDKHISVADCRKRFYKALEEIYITKEIREKRGIKFYHLKHSCITRLKKGGVDIKEMKDITGHKRMESLEHYFESDLDDMDRNFDKDRMSKKYLNPRDRYRQLVETLMKLDKELGADSHIESYLTKKNNEISITIKLKSGDCESHDYSKPRSKKH